MEKSRQYEGFIQREGIVAESTFIKRIAEVPSEAAS